ncbi:hypothetical protein [Stratiformator vulcanicus]|uniref:hypothetical protein n=1 Tax=Stratiformator vulcanicus TaxID=2527980 RepID=UPI0011A6E00A
MSIAFGRSKKVANRCRATIDDRPRTIQYRVIEGSWSKRSKTVTEVTAETIKHSDYSVLCTAFNYDRA